MWAKLEPYYDEPKRAEWMKAHEARMKVLHYDIVEKFEADWYAATIDVQTKAYFRQHFDSHDPNDDKKAHSPGGVYAAESHSMYAPGPESKGPVLTAYLSILDEDVREDTAVFLRSLVCNQASLFSFVHKQVTGDPGDTGVRDKVFDIFKEHAPKSKKFSWLGDGIAFFGIGQMTAVSGAALSAAGALLTNTQRGRQVLSKVKQLWCIHQSIEFWRKAAMEGGLRNRGPKAAVLIYKSVDRLTAFAAMKMNPNAASGMTHKEVYNHTKNNQKILIALMTDTDAVLAVGGRVEEIGRTVHATDIKLGPSATAAIAASSVSVSESQALALVTQESAKSTVAVNAVRSALATGQRTGVNAVFMSLDGRIALGSVFVQAIGIYYTFLTIRNEKDAEKVRDAWLGMADSGFGAIGGLMQMITVGVEAFHHAGAASTGAAESAIEKSKLIGGLRFAGAMVGVAGGAINAYAMFLQADKAKNAGNSASFQLYTLSSFMFAGTAVASVAVGITALSITAVANGSVNPLLARTAARTVGVTLLRVAGVTVLSASGIGWVFLVVGVGAQLTAIALTPTEMQRWVSRSYFGRDRNIFGQPDGRRRDSFQKGKWAEERAGLALAMKETAIQTDKYLADEAANAKATNK